MIVFDKRIVLVFSCLLIFNVLVIQGSQPRQPSISAVFQGRMQSGLEGVGVQSFASNSVPMQEPEYSNFFSNLFGFNEESYDVAKKELCGRMRWEETSSPHYLKNVQFTGVGPLSNGVVRAGTFVVPRVDELEAIVRALIKKGVVRGSGEVNHRAIFGDCMSYHIKPAYNGAVFQAASQFNMLEFASPYVTPEAGISCYEGDNTQGPACAIACTAGIAFRNYGVRMPLTESSKLQSGQTHNNQINGLMDLEKILFDKYKKNYWSIKNGYSNSTDQDLDELNILLQDQTLVNKLKQSLRIGVHWNTEVTHKNREDCFINFGLARKVRQIVTQTYNSALAIGCYSSCAPALWEPLARLILEATYDATLFVAVINNLRRAEQGLSPLPVVLTLVGGGVFGNELSWIGKAIGMAMKKVKALGQDLEVHVNHYNKEDLAVTNAINDELSEPFVQNRLDENCFKSRPMQKMYTAFYNDFVGNNQGGLPPQTGIQASVQVPVGVASKINPSAIYMKLSNGGLFQGQEVIALIKSGRYTSSDFVACEQVPSSQKRSPSPQKRGSPLLESQEQMLTLNEMATVLKKIVESYNIKIYAANEIKAYMVDETAPKTISAAVRIFNMYFKSNPIPDLPVITSSMVLNLLKKGADVKRILDGE